ncbi:MAG: hypothetical protein AB7H80_04370 [Candidatus Kapaibacterium sp.]
MNGRIISSILFLFLHIHCTATPSDSLSTYDSLLVRLDTIRTIHARNYKAVNKSKQDSILDEARKAFTASVVDSIAPHWMGTIWDFNGTTEKPRKGMIACGYFVSTLLRDAGLKVERVKMAQQASEKIVKALATKNEIKRFRNTDFTKFIDTIAAWGAGLYVVGLDYHVGFLYHDGEGVWFIHSSFIAPKCVVREVAEKSLILASSKYRVVGKISANDGLIKKWLRGESVRVG